MESIPYDKRSGKIWFDGKSVNWSDVKIHVLSHGLHYASCVLKAKEFMMGKYLNSKNIQTGCFTQLLEWVLKFHILQNY